MRKLASIRTIDRVRPIENADAIECVSVDGWDVVAKRGEFTVGEKCVYFEIDSFLPIQPEFEFLRGSSYRNVNGLGEGFRLRTVKLRGQLSQGLALPVAAFGMETLDVGTDVTDQLGVRKYEAPLPASLAGEIAGRFPTFIPKTDEERIQNCWVTVLQDYWSEEFEVTLKLDGASCTVYWFNGHVGVCSRNYELKINDANSKNTLVSTALASGLVSALGQLKANIAVQAECMGPGIQRNREKLVGTRLFVFNIWDIDNQCYLRGPDRMAMLVQLNLLGLNNVCLHAPVLEHTRLKRFNSVTEILEYAEGDSYTKGVQREGVVFKHLTSDFSFKAISNKFLLKAED